MSRAGELVDVKTIAAAMGVTVQAVRKRAKKEGWLVGRFAGQARAALYQAPKLPRPVREALAAAALRSGAVPDLPAPIEAASRGVPAALDERRPSDPRDLKGWQRQAMEARLALLAEVDRLAATAGRLRAREAVAEAAARGELAPGLQRLVGAATRS